MTNKTIELANRLVGGLASENVRWAESVKQFKIQENTLPGDVLLITAFVSYVGCFTKQYRLDLMNNCWLPFLKGLKKPIAITEDLDVLTMLTEIIAPRVRRITLDTIRIAVRCVSMDTPVHQVKKMKILVLNCFDTY